MASKDYRTARQQAKRTAQQAVRLFVHEPSVNHEQAVSQAWARVRMLEELRSRRPSASSDQQ